MTESDLFTGGKSRRLVWKKSLALLTVLCAVGGAIYITKAGEKIHKAVNDFINSHFLEARQLTLKPTDPLKFKNAAVAADYKTCSEYGVKILRYQKGNAVDAAIATALCVGVVNAHSAGIGGGGFMIIYEKKSGKRSVINFREAVAARENAETVEEIQHILAQFTERDQKTGNSGEGEFLGVPGELRGFEVAWKKYGRLPWKDLFQPAIEIATKGFPANAALELAVSLNQRIITNDPGLSELFKPNGRFIKKGDPIKRTKYEKTLKTIAELGADEFYTGEMAKQVIKDFKSIHSKITLKDLRDYKAIEVEPLEAPLPKMKGYKILTSPPPAGGAALINILNILNGFNFSAADMKDRPILTYHRMIEAFNFVAAKETYLTDPRFSDKTNEVVKEMLDPEKGEELRKLIDGKTHPADYYGPINYHIDVTDGTIHLSVLDEEGNAAAITTSINKYFGAKFRSKELGIIYNDQLLDAVNMWVTEYHLEPDSFKPHKRPLSMASPSIILDDTGNVKMVFGAAGGKYIATTLAQVLMNYFWFGDSLKDAVSKPRLHSQLFPNYVLVEPNFPKKYIKGLKKFGHKHITNDTMLFTATPKQMIGVVQLVVRENGEILALADHRKGGIVAGYR
ncbi:glutathione hydrolase 1 proenzyme-like [Oculina patagonica]